MVLRLQLTQPYLKLGLFRHEFAAKSDDYLLMKLPQLLQGHRLQVVRFHWILASPIMALGNCGTFSQSLGPRHSQMQD
jgi:hypothetical protein